MNEQEDETGGPAEAGRIQVLERVKPAGHGKKGGFVVDLSGIKELDVVNLAMLLTAQQRAERENRDVWLAGVPLNVWKALHAMGLGALFKPFPVSGEVAA